VPLIFVPQLFADIPATAPMWAGQRAITDETAEQARFIARETRPITFADARAAGRKGQVPAIRGNDMELSGRLIASLFAIAA
jgi:hypothetical protein